MLWKKQGISLTFWLLLPLLATISITAAAGVLQDDTKIPVGLILEEETKASMELVQEIKTTPFVRVKKLSKSDALYYLKKHELDSVFIIHEGFQEKVLEDNRNQVITSYQSDLSFAYSPVKEMILSYVQQETGRSKAASIVKELERRYEVNKGWTFEGIISKSKKIQMEENLLKTAFSLSDSPVNPNESLPLFSIWGLWALFSMLSTMLLFDWVIKEKNSKVIMRFAFTRWSFKSYLIYNFILYSALLFVVDLFAGIALYFIFGEWISIVNLIIFRILINLAAFLLALLFRNSFLFYTVSFGLTLFIAISSGAVLPSGLIANWSWFDLFNPILPLLTGKFISLWSFSVCSLAILWFVRKEKYHA